MRKKRRFWEEEKGKRSISLFIARVQPIIYSIYLFLNHKKPTSCSIYMCGVDWTVVITWKGYSFIAALHNNVITWAVVDCVYVALLSCVWQMPVQPARIYAWFLILCYVMLIWCLKYSVALWFILYWHCSLYMNISSYIYLANLPLRL